MLQAEFPTFPTFPTSYIYNNREICNINEKISGISLNSGKQKEAKELEHFKKENEKKTLIIKSL